MQGIAAALTSLLYFKQKSVPSLFVSHRRGPM